MLGRRPSFPFWGICGTTFLLGTQTASALEPQKPVTQYVHDAWRTEDGLPQNSVLAIAQTPDGYLWLATQEGLARFDGVRFTVFDKNNTQAIRNNYIQALCAARDGSL